MKRSPMRAAACLAAIALLGGCAARPAPDAHVPPFARVPYEPFSRRDAIAIALREWRSFGSPVNDDPPEARSAAESGETAERQPGLWQRVGEYWWLGQDAGRPESAWTGKHGDDGAVFPAARDGDYAWSAAFISYVMRTAGARDGFPYSPAHSAYINAARSPSSGLRIRAERLESYPPRPGDLICMGRLWAKDLTYDDLPAGDFAGHCDLVVEAGAGTLVIVGGNVDDAVTVKHVPIAPDGRLVGADGRVLDERYAWFVVVRVLYDD